MRNSKQVSNCTLRRTAKELGNDDVVLRQPNDVIPS
jgi:hypothetical protein